MKGPPLAGRRSRSPVAGALVALWLAAAPPAAAEGPVRVGAHLVAAYTDNLFHSYSQRSDWTQQLFVDVGCGGPGLAAYYSAQVQLFAEYEDLFTQTHVLGVSASRSGPGRRLVTGEVNLTARAGRPGYEYKDYVEGGGYLAAKLYPRPTLMVRTGAGLRLREYGRAGDFSYAEPTAYLQLSRFLPTRTTLVAGVDLGLKAYLRAADRAPEEDLAYARTADDDAQMQARVWFKVAQSLAPHTGLQLQYTGQALPAGGTRYRYGEEYDPTEELFDDGYSYSGHTVRVAVKHQGAAGFDLLTRAHRASRHYEGRPALGLDGRPVDGGRDRRDRVAGLLVRADRDPISHGPGALANLGLRLEWSLLSTDSNDSYFDASTRVYSVALKMGL